MDATGGVPPGETPPNAAQTSASSNADPTAGRDLTPRSILGIVAVAVFVLVFAAVAVVLVVQMVNAFG